MDTKIAAVVDSILTACARNDTAAFRAGAAELKRLVAITSPGGSIGPGMAFKTLAPAGNAIGEAMREMAAGEAIPLLESLASDDSPEMRCVACRALSQMGALYPEHIIPLAHQLAADSSWEVREFIANALDDMEPAQGEFVYRLMEQWVHDPDPNVRRASTNALMRYGRRHPQAVLRLIEALRHDDSRYVRDNVVFCLGVMGSVKVPLLGPESDASKPRLLLDTLREWANDEDERTRWIVAKTLGRSWAKSCPEEALALLRDLADDRRKAVAVAVASSVKGLAKYCPVEVRAAIERWRNDQDEQVRAAASAAAA